MDCRRLLLLLALGPGLAACDDSSVNPLLDAGAKACAPGTAILSTPPLPLASVTGWVPLGNLNPVSHTFPTDHQYLYYSTGGGTSTPIAIFSPATMWVTRAKVTQYSTGSSDFAFEFQPCLDVKGEFGHVSSILARIVNELGAFDQNCQTYSPNPGLTVTSCYTKPGAVKVDDGESIGIVGPAGTSIALDFSLWDKRVPPIVFANPTRWFVNSDGFDRYHVVPASDYYAEPAKSQIAAKLGSYNGVILRTIPPVGGTIAADSDGVQGHWFVSGQPTFPESNHLAIARDNVTPSDYAISVGTSQPGFTGGSFPFTPSTSGTNLSPAMVSVASGIVCFQAKNSSVVLVQAIAANQIRVEVRSGTPTCASQGPYAFTAGKTTDYYR